MAVNNYPGVGIYTKQELAQWVMQNPTNVIGWACNRNPTYVYDWIKRNYPQFGRLANGMQATSDGIRQMYEFLEKQFNSLPANQRAHWLVTLTAKLPVAIETKNWTTPKN